jgi:hypothetical protein
VCERVFVSQVTKKEEIFLRRPEETNEEKRAWGLG